MSDSAISQPLGRLILVATSAWLLSKRDAQLLGIRYQPRPEPELGTDVSYGELLRRILDHTLPGQAWIRRDTPGETADTAMNAATDGYLALPEAAELIDDLKADIHRARAAAKASAGASASTVQSGQLAASLRHRLFIDAERFLAVTGAQPPGVPFWVVLDLRFSGLFDQLRCHASVSVWSAPPRHRRHRPDAAALDGDTILEVSVVECERAFGAIAEKAEQLLSRYLFGVHMHVFEREYTLPVFWVAVPAVPPADAMDYVESRVDWTSERTEELLGLSDVRDRALTRSVLNGAFFIARRVIRTEIAADGHTAASRNVPTYLVLPGGRDLLAEGATAEDLAARRADVEFAAAEVITELTDLEAEAANLLHLRLRDLEVWSNHLKVYNAVVERGAFLWDALSTHLMIRWGLPFEKAHNAVDMLHQVLQQAVADLRHIATLTHQAVAGVNQAADLLQDSYDQRIGERTATAEPGLRAALTETGLFGRATRIGNEVLGRAERVKTAYDDLLKAIAGAFDERRVRELDGTQKAGFFVGFFAALIGLVAVMDATVNMKPDEGSDEMTILGNLPHLNEVALWVSVGLGGIVLTLSLALLIQVRNIGKLGTPTFRKLYHGSTSRWRKIPSHIDGLWRFLKDTSTDHQKRIRLRQLKNSDQEWEEVWSKHDTRSAEAFVAVWDAARNLQGCERHDEYHKDIKGLSRLIEQWGVHSLVLTERTRVMHWFDLPNLTCLYRCCTRIRQSFLDLSDLDDKPPITMVADIDMVLSLMRLGFTRDEAHDLDRWLIADKFDSAADAYARVQRLGLEVGMDALARQAALDVARL